MQGLDIEKVIKMQDTRSVRTHVNGNRYESQYLFALRYVQDG